MANDSQKTTRLRLPSPAMTVACIALAVALSGASYAAVVLPRNSVGTPQLKRDAVVSSKVKNRSLRAIDFARGQLPAGAQGPAGPAGPAGAQGPMGPRGPSFGHSHSLSSVPITGCGGNLTALSYAVTITEPSRIFASAYSKYLRTDPGPEDPVMRVDLMSPGGQLLASLREARDNDVPPNIEMLSISGVMLTPTPVGTSGGTPFVAAAGSYTLRVHFINFDDDGDCSGTGTWLEPTLSHIVLGTG